MCPFSFLVVSSTKRLVEDSVTQFISQPRGEHLHALVVEQSWSKVLASSAAMAGASRLSI